MQETKKGGRYTKDEQRKRRDEVYRLYFEYGYSARKIAEFLKINRNTINRDVMYWHTEIEKKWEHTDIENFVINQIERLELQRTRLRKQLDKAESFQEKMSIEKFIFSIDTKIANFQIKIIDSASYTAKEIVNRINDWYEKENSEKRIISPDVFLKVSDKARKEITKIYEEDMKF